jgi:hypothetical protein
MTYDNRGRVRTELGGALSVAAAADQPVAPAQQERVDFEFLKAHLGAAIQFAERGGEVIVVDGRTDTPRARITGCGPDGSWAVAS